MCNGKERAEQKGHVLNAENIWVQESQGDEAEHIFELARVMGHNTTKHQQARSDGAQHLHWLPLHHTLLQQKDFICTKSSSDTFNLALQPSIPTLSESQDRCAYFTIVNLLSDITPTLLPEPLCKMAYKSDHHGLHPYPGQFREDIVFSSN